MLIPIKYKVITHAWVDAEEWKHRKPEVLKNTEISEFMKFENEDGKRKYYYKSSLDKDTLLDYLEKMDSIKWSPTLSDPDEICLLCTLDGDDINIHIRARAEDNYSALLETMDNEERKIKQLRITTEIKNYEEHLLNLASHLDILSFLNEDNLKKVRELLPKDIEVDLHTYEMFV